MLRRTQRLTGSACCARSGSSTTASRMRVPRPPLPLAEPAPPRAQGHAAEPTLAAATGGWRRSSIAGSTSGGSAARSPSWRRRIWRVWGWPSRRTGANPCPTKRGRSPTATFCRARLTLSWGTAATARASSRSCSITRSCGAGSRASPCSPSARAARTRTSGSRRSYSTRCTPSPSPLSSPPLPVAPPALRECSAMDCPAGGRRPSGR
jgi:hypothetical protein